MKQGQAFTRGNLRTVLALAVLVLAATHAPVSAEQVEGPLSPGTLATVAPGTTAWTNFGNAGTSDDTYAVAAPGGVPTQYLQATAFGFTIPSPAVIRGIEVDIERRSTGGTVFDSSVRIVKGTVISGSEHAAVGMWPMMDTVQTYGSNTDLWGEAWTAADINAAGFGVAISADDNVDTAAVDAISITVYYNLCPDTPRGTCRPATKNVLVIKNKTPDDKDKLVWKWIKGDPTTQVDFANPQATAQYDICFYQGMVGTTLFAEATVPPSLTLWKQLSTKGYKYKDKPGSADGITKIVLKGSTDPAKSKIIVKGKGINLPTLDPDFDDPVTVQAINSATGICWESVFNAPFVKNDSTKGLFKDKE